MDVRMPGNRCCSLVVLVTLFLVSGMFRRARANHPATTNIGELILTRKNDNKNQMQFRTWICAGRKKKIDLSSQDIEYSVVSKPITRNPKRLLVSASALPGSILHLTGVQPGGTNMKFRARETGENTYYAVQVQVRVVSCKNHGMSKNDGRKVDAKGFPDYPGLPPNKMILKNVKKRSNSPVFVYDMFVCPEGGEVDIHFQEKTRLRDFRNRNPAFFRIEHKKDPAGITIRPNPNKSGKNGLFLFEGKNVKIVVTPPKGGGDPKTKFYEVKVYLHLIKKCNPDVNRTRTKDG